MKQSTQAADLASQAQQVRKRYAHLFDYLERRDRALRAALASIPCETDVELGSTFNVHAWTARLAEETGPGVAELANRR